MNIISVLCYCKEKKYVAERVVYDKSGGFSDKAFLSWADRKGLIETQGGRMTKVKKVDGNPIRCVFLRLNDNIDKDGFEPVETMDKYEQEKLPFK